MNSRSYVSALHAMLAGTSAKGVRKPRGSILRLAEHLHCHPSFIAQVLADRANLSVDQALLTAEYFHLDSRAKEHFIDLMLMDRSATPSAKAYFSKRVGSRVMEGENLAKRWKAKSELSGDENWDFFSSWINQTIYSLLHISRFQDTKAISGALNLSVAQVERVLSTLKRLQLIEVTKNRIRPMRNWMHLSRDSPVIQSHHQTWRLRAIEEFSKPQMLNGFHYSGALTLSVEDAALLRAELLKTMDKIRQVVSQSDSKVAFALNLDFFSLT